MPLPDYFRRLQKLLLRRGTAHADAEDLIQEAYLKMQEYCAKGGEVRQPAAFMARTAIRLGLNAKRDAHPELYSQQKVEELTFVVDSNPTPDEVMAADQCLEHMRQELDSLSRKTREIFLMNRLDGMTYAQIARQLGVSPSAIEKHVAIALVKLSNAVKDE